MGPKDKGQTIQWGQKIKTDNTMVPKDKRTDNTMGPKDKDRQYNGAKR